MKLRNLGKCGLKVSVAGLGCNNFGGRIDIEETRKVVYKALDLGITLFDTADSYGNRGGSETYLGKVLGSRRKDVILATKFASKMDDAGTMKGASRRYIMSAVEDSLRRLNTDWIDLYQQHWLDPDTPTDETLRALDDLVRQGKVRYIGCCNYTAWHVTDALWISRKLGIHSFVSCQNEYSLLARDAERELLPAIDHFGLGMLPYFPLASGLLTGKYERSRPAPKDTRLAAWPQVAERFLSDANWQIIERLKKFCAERKRSMAELAIAWLSSHAQVSSVIAGATKPEQVEQNAAAVDWELTPEEMSEVDRLSAKD